MEDWTWLLSSSMVLNRILGSLGLDGSFILKKDEKWYLPIELSSGSVNDRGIYMI